MTTSSGSSSSSTPVIVSGEDDDDVPVYLPVCRENDEDVLDFRWCIIKTISDRYNFTDKTSKKKEVSPPVFEPEPSFQEFAGCVFVGGTLYVLGGMDFKQISHDTPYGFFHRAMRRAPRCEVFSIDTTILGAEWKKLDHSMNLPRSRPYAFALDGKIYVMGSDESSPKPEVLDTRRMDLGWRELQDSKDMPGRFDGHAVLDGGKRIVLQYWRLPNLYCYDVEADSWQVYRQDIPGLGFINSAVDWESAFLDGILYYLDKNCPGFLFGLDLSRPDHDTAKPKRVRLPLGKANWKHWGYQWIPKLPPVESDLCLPITHLVSLGSGKLAVVWSSFSCDGVGDVYCSTVEMSKDKKKQEEGGGGDDFDLVARPLCLSHVVVHGKYLADCFAV